MSDIPHPPRPPRPAPRVSPNPVLRPVGSSSFGAAPRTIFALMLREMATSYGRSWGGYIWAVAEPVGGIVLLTFLLSLVARQPGIGTNFAIFYATGVVVFTFYTEISTKVSQSVTYSRQLLAYPAVTLMDAVLARLLVNLLTQLMIGFLIFGYILLTMETRTDPRPAPIALAYLMALVLAFGVGTLNCALYSFFPTWQKIWGIVNRPLFLASCIFFVFDAVPKPFQDYLWYNPLVHVVGQMRKGFYPQYTADYVSVTYVMGFGLICLVIGLAVLARFSREILDEV